jgi:hypothetical protein
MSTRPELQMKKGRWKLQIERSVAEGTRLAFHTLLHGAQKCNQA